VLRATWRSLFARKLRLFLSAFAVILGVHWLGAVLAIALFALWCARLAHDRSLAAGAA